MNEQHLTALEALGIAIRAETDAAQIYTELAARVGNPLLKQRIVLLAKEESQHRRILEEQYKAQFPEVPLALPPSQLPKVVSSPSGREQLSMKDFLRLAMEEERRSREFYLAQAEQTDDPTGKRMFNFLADWEFSHQMALNAQYEMLERYPRHFEQAAEPWKPEFRR